MINEDSRGLNYSVVIQSPHWQLCPLHCLKYHTLQLISCDKQIMSNFHEGALNEPFRNIQKLFRNVSQDIWLIRQILRTISVKKCELVFLNTLSVVT